MDKSDKLDIDKLETVPVDISKLSDLVITKVVKKTLYDKLVKRVNVVQAIDPSKLFQKIEYDANIKDIEDKIPNLDKYITIYELNKYSIEEFEEKIKRSKIGNK